MVFDRSPPVQARAFTQLAPVERVEAFSREGDKAALSFMEGKPHEGKSTLG